MLARVGRLDPQQLLHLSLYPLALPYIALHTLLQCLLRPAPTPKPLTSDTLIPSPPHPFSPHVHANATYPSKLYISV